jgi:peptide/nickel transport system permease protein
MIKKETRRHFLNRLSITVVWFYLIMALGAPLLAGDKPLFISSGGRYYFPAFSGNPYIELPGPDGRPVKTLIQNVDWKKFKETAIFPPVNWSPVSSDLNNILVSPFAGQVFIDEGRRVNIPARFRHFLGTGSTGNDVLSGLIHGSRTSLAIGIFSTLLALIPGVLLGALAGYLGDDKLKIRRGNLFLLFVMLVPAWFYSFHLRREILVDGFNSSLVAGWLQLSLSLLMFAGLFTWPLLIDFSRVPFLQKRLRVPVDTLVSRTIEIFLSLPRLILILTLAALSRPSVLSLILIIGLTSWTETARLVRGQFLLLREMNYVSAAVSFGSRARNVLLRHLLPNALAQVVVVGVFGVASAILVETGLSFLGVGVPAGNATWGSLIFQARQNYEAWWIVVFPGIAISLLLFALINLSGQLRNRSVYKARFLNKF